MASADNSENIQNSTLSHISTDNDKRLHDTLVSLQRTRMLFIGPLTLVVLVVLYATVEHNWQTLFLAVAMAISELFFIASYKQAKEERISSSLSTGIGAAMFFSASVTWIYSGFLPLAMLAFLGLIVQTSIFSLRVAAYMTVLAFALFTSAELVAFFQPWPLQTVASSTRIVVVLLISLALMIQFFDYLRKKEAIHHFFLERTLALTKDQDRAIHTVKSITPQIDKAVDLVNKASSELASGAASQANSIAEISTTTEELATTAEQSTVFANQTREASDITRQEIQRTSLQVHEMEREFQNTYELMIRSGTKITRLIDTVEQIENVLFHNESIGERVKVLAVNAAIEAAKAGASGRGFAVVASELRELISSTEQSLKSGHELLRHIRIDSAEGGASIKETEKKMTVYKDSLKDIRSAMDLSARRYEEASKQVVQIATSADQQRIGIKEMKGGVSLIETASFTLTNLSYKLLETVGDINDAKEQLSKIVNDRS